MVGKLQNPCVSCVIAIDGGGSKTEAAAVDVSGRVLALYRTGATNPNDLGETEAARRLTDLLSRFDPALRPSAVYAGISGAVGHEKALTAALTAACPGVPARVRTDIYNLFGLMPDADDCAALICGTGAVCFARKGGELHRVGGWGWLLDSHTGGYAIGRDGLEAALRAADGRGAQTSLTDAAARYLGKNVTDAIGTIYGGGKPLIAGFAPSVFDEAERGDAVASAILDTSARELAEMLRAASVVLGGKPFPCLVSGSVIADARMRVRLDAALAEGEKSAGTALRVRIVSTPLPQLCGAARAAFAAAGLAVAPRFPDEFARSCASAKTED